MFWLNRRRGRRTMIEPAAPDTEACMDELAEFVSIPSVSADPACRPSLIEAAGWLGRRLMRTGAEQIRIQEYRGIPMVTADLSCGDRNAPVLLLYGHYDVQPPGPAEQWDSDPFRPERRGDNLYGRGMTDMKGQIIALFAALDSCLAADSLGWNIKFLFEGAEESDGSLLEGFISEHTDLLVCDLVLNVDAGMIGPDSPSIVYGCRGIAAGRLVMSGPVKDLHCGEFGGAVLNPVHALCRAIAGLHDPEGRIALPGFYDTVCEPDGKERQCLADLPMNDAFFLEETGVSRLWGEPGYTPLERTVARPVLEVVNLSVSGMASSISPEASALLIFRLVPDQEPGDVRRLLEEHLNESVSPAVSWRLEGWSGCPASVTDPFSPAAAGLRESLRQVWKKEPLLTRTGGSLPMAGYFREYLGAEVLMTGFQLPEDNMHGPNEKIHIPTWEKGCRALRLFFSGTAPVLKKS